MTKAFIVITCIFTIAAPVLSQDLPEYMVMRTTGKIVIDGIPDEQDWA